MVTPLWSDNPTALDLLGFADVAAPISEAVLRDKLDPVTVGIEGDWGSGKTSMLDLLAAELREDASVVVVQTHPWEYDPATDAKATLIAEVLTAIHQEAEKRKALTDALREKFKSLAKRVRVSKAIKLAVNSVLSLGLPKIEELLGLFDDEAETVPDPTLQGFRGEFKDLMREMSEVQRVVVLVDDLDRCLPETVVATLEAVKLFLSVPKMAFVLAADRRAVAHAVATKYFPSPRAEELGRQYLEKIIHIPVRVPALGRAETETYLALLMLQRHLDSTGLLPLIEHCNSRRAAGEGRILDKLPQEGLNADAKSDLQLAAMLAPILYERLGGNPRRLKRFLNSYWIRDTVARKRGVALQPNALAKLMVLEHVEDSAFATVLGWLREGVLSDRLKVLESGGDGVEGPGGTSIPDVLRSWAKINPPLSKVELDSYLRLAAALRSQVGPEAGLPREVSELVEAALSSSASTRKDAVNKRIPAAPQQTRLAVARFLVDFVKSNPDRQADVAPALGKLAEEDVVAREIVPDLAGIAPEHVTGPLVLYLAPAKKAQSILRPIVMSWVESGRLDKGAEAVARKNLGLEDMGSS